MANSCQKEPIIWFGFDCDFGEKSQGLTIMNVGSSTKSITLTGEVVVAEGEVLVELIKPIGETTFSSHLISPKSFYVNETFTAIPGNWKLMYKSIEGKGSLTLHLNTIN
ncbi:MAG: hypothetical protein AB9846_03100 [Tenuifilaceae bacterium]